MRPGDLYLSDFEIPDPAGVPQVGLAPTITGSSDPNGDPIAGATVSEVEPGIYRVACPTATTWVVGTYTIFLAANDPYFQDFISTFDLEAELLYAATSGVSLGALRRAIARRLDDLVTVTVTVGSINAATDPLALVENTDHFRGAELLVTSGASANVGLVRRVMASSFPDSSISFLPDLPAPLTLGDTLELYHHGPVPVRVAEYRDFINDAIDAAYPQSRIPLRASLAGTYALDAEVAIPEEFTFLSKVEAQDATGVWFELANATIEGGGGWYAAFNSGVLTLSGTTASYADGCPLRLTGYGRPGHLVADTDVTAVDQEWITEVVLGQLTTRRLDQATYPIGQGWANRADQLRAKLAAAGFPNTVKIRG